MFLLLLNLAAQSQRRRNYVSNNPELGFNLPSILEKTAEMRLVLFPNNDASFQIGFGGMFNSNLKGSFEPVEDGTSSWSNSGYYGSFGIRVNFLRPRFTTDYYMAGKFALGYFDQTCQYTNPKSNNTTELKANGMFNSYCLEAGARLKADANFSFDFGIQFSVPTSKNSKQASESFSVLPGTGPVAIGGKPRLLLIIAPKISF